MYQVAVVAEPDAERALQLAAGNPPALIVLGIEDTDSRTGFRTFEKCKKGALATIPIVITTGSIPPETFAKHRALKNHADAYVDKRAISSQELIAVIDRLIGLDDDLSIPIEDEIPMEIVEDDLELEPADDHREFDTSDTAGSPAGRAVDSVVEAETEAAFAALFDDDDLGAAPPATASARAVTATAEPDVPAPQPVVQPAPVAEPAPQPEVEAEADIDDAYEGDTIDYVEDLVLTQGEPATAESAPVVEAPAPLEFAEPEPALPAATAPHAIAAHHLVDPFAGEVPETRRTQPLFGGPNAGLDTPGSAGVLSTPTEEMRRSIDLGPLTPLPPPEPAAAHDPADTRRIGELEADIARLKTTLDRASAPAPGQGREAQFTHLREAMLAKDTELAQLTETVAARDRDLAAANEKLRQIQHARSALESKNTELEERLLDERSKWTQLSASARTSAAQLTVVQQELEAMTKAHGTAEAARVQLEQELAKERTVAATVTSETEQLRAERDQLLAHFKTDLATAKAESHNAQAHAIAEMREQLELAHRASLSEVVEEARRVAATQQQDALSAVKRAHASEIIDLQAEHAREQTNIRSEFGAEIARVEAALTAAHAAHRDTIAAHDAAASKVQAQHREIVAAQERALAQAKADHEHDLAQVTTAHADEIRQLKAAHDSEIAAYETELSQTKATHQRALAALQDQLATTASSQHDTLSRVQSEYREELAAARTVMQEAMANAEAAHRNELAEQAAQHAAAVEQLHRNAETHLDRIRSDHAAALAASEDALKAARLGHAADLERLRGSHAAELAAREEAYEEMCDRELSAHESEVAELRAELQRTASAHELTLDVAKRELAEHTANAERSLAALRDQHAQALAQAIEARDTAHKAEMAKLRSEIDQASEAARRDAEANRRALVAAEAAHAVALSRASEAAQQEVEEFRAAAEAAKRELADTLAQLQAERDELQRLRQGLADQQAAIAADQAKALAAQKAEAEKLRAELTAERDKLQQELATAREGLTRSAGELTTAVQSIADRNAELRAHAAAIIERDQRIAELRKEIESIEAENAGYQDQVLRAYQKIKTDEAMVARARKAMAIALTVLDDDGKPTTT